MHIVARTLGLVVSIAAGAIATANSAHAEIASHRALYTLSLGKAVTGSDIADVDGRMEYSVARVCEGWASKQRTVIRFVSAGGEELLIDTNFTAFESLDGRRIRFEQRTRYNNEIHEELSGEATVGPDGGEARYEKPETMTRPLPAGILFPMRFAEQVLARARAGDMQIKAVVFEASTLDSPFDASAVIIPVSRSRDVPGLAGASEAWKARIAYFPLGSRDASPAVEIGLALRNDGISSDFEWDYDSYTVKGELSAVTLLTPQGC